MRNYLTYSVLLAAAPGPSVGDVWPMGGEPKPAPSQMAGGQPKTGPRFVRTWGAARPSANFGKAFMATMMGAGGITRFEEKTFPDSLAWRNSKLTNPPSAVQEERFDDLAYGCFPPSALESMPPSPPGCRSFSSPTLMLFGQNVRQIYTDGRQHPKDLHPLWMGHSIGSWEGDTFVVDTVGIDDRTWIDRMGHPHSDALHFVERFRRVLQYAGTGDDDQLSEGLRGALDGEESFPVPAASARAGGEPARIFSSTRRLD